eukprot:gene10521-448_t
MPAPNEYAQAIASSASSLATALTQYEDTIQHVAYASVAHWPLVSSYTVSKAMGEGTLKLETIGKVSKQEVIAGTPCICLKDAFHRMRGMTQIWIPVAEDTTEKFTKKDFIVMETWAVFVWLWRTA